MQGVLIADDNLDSCKLMADLFAGAGYDIMVTNSAATILLEVLKKTAQVIVIGNDIDEMAVTDLIPLLKKCNRDLSIIFVSRNASLPLLRKLRNDGIFYHSLPPEQPTERAELKQAVECAFESHRGHSIH